MQAGVVEVELPAQQVRKPMVQAHWEPGQHATGEHGGLERGTTTRSLLRPLEHLRQRPLHRARGVQRQSGARRTMLPCRSCTLITPP